MRYSALVVVALALSSCQPDHQTPTQPLDTPTPTRAGGIVGDLPASLAVLTDPAAFDAVCPGLPVEDFENWDYVNAGPLCAAPLSSLGDPPILPQPSCYPPGEMLDGFSLDILNDDGFDKRWIELWWEWDDKLPYESNNGVGPARAVDHVQLAFAATDAIGVSLATSWWTSGTAVFTVEAFGHNGVPLGSFSVDPPEFPDLDFVGIRGDSPIERLVLSSPGLAPGQDIEDLDYLIVDDLEFGLCALDVTIDVRPGSERNSVNCRADRAVIPVALLSTDDFDATTVDHTSVSFEGATETHRHPRSGEPRRHVEDVDGDGDLDLVFHVRLEETDLDCGSSRGVLKGYAFDGRRIQGSDLVRMVG